MLVNVVVLWRLSHSPTVSEDLHYNAEAKSAKLDFQMLEAFISISTLAVVSRTPVYTVWWECHQRDGFPPDGHIHSIQAANFR